MTYPPYVDPCSPGLMQSIISLLAMTHETGYTKGQPSEQDVPSEENCRTASRECFSEDDHIGLDVVPLVAEPTKSVM